MAKKLKRKNDFINEMESMLLAEDVGKANKLSKNILFQISLKELREKRGLTQEDIHAFKQASVSKIESRKDIKLSTLIDYLHCLGMEIEIRARPKGEESKRKDVILLKQ